MLDLFKKSSPIGWAANDEGVSIFFKKKGTYQKALRRRADERLNEVAALFERLLECGEANVESDSTGIFVAEEDAVRLDSRTRSLLDLPPIWPGFFRLDTLSVPNLRDFEAALRFIDSNGLVCSQWKRKGAILRIGEDNYLLSAGQFACIRAFERWKALPTRTESDHLHLLHTLTEAAESGCRIDVSRIADIKILIAEECAIDSYQKEDQSVLLTPIPLAQGLHEHIVSRLGPDASPSAVLAETRTLIGGRLSQLEGDSPQAILRVGKTIVLLNEECTAQMRAVAKHRRVPKECLEDYKKSPEAWLAQRVFSHGDVEFLPRVLGIAHWRPGYVGAGGELGEKIDWFEAAYGLSEESKNGGENGGGTQNTPASGSLEGPLTFDISRNDTDTDYGGIRDPLAPPLPGAIIINPCFDSYPRKPFPHQIEAIEWLGKAAKRGGNPKQEPDEKHAWGAGALLADDMGLGKTLSTLLFMGEWIKQWHRQLSSEVPACLVVCPLSLIGNWAAEIEESFHPSQRPFKRVIKAIPDGDLQKFYAIRGGRDVVTPGDAGGAVEQYGLKFGDRTEQSLDCPGNLVLTTYDTLSDRRFSFAGCDWGVVIFDEAQAIKNPNAMRTIASKSLKGFLRIALSGTPVENHLGDLWCLMDTIEPGALGAFSAFRDKWISPIRKDPSKLNEVGESLRAAIDPYFLRRTKEESLTGLPAKHIAKVSIPMSEKQAMVYDEILRFSHSEAKSDNARVRSNQWLQSIWALRRVSLHPAFIGNGFHVASKSPRDSRAFLEQSGKLQWLLQQLDQISQLGEKILIFAIQKSFQTFLQAHLQTIYGREIPIINGDTKAISDKAPNQTRLGLIKTFSSAEGFQICILSPIAAGAGLNIIAANHVIHLERHWNPAKEDQATDRAYRIGQKRPVTVYLPLLTHVRREITTFDLGLDKLITQKRALSGSLGFFPPEKVSQDELCAEIFADNTKLTNQESPRLSIEDVAFYSVEWLACLVAELLLKTTGNYQCQIRHLADQSAVELAISPPDQRECYYVLVAESHNDEMYFLKALEAGRLYSEKADGKRFPHKKLFLRAEAPSKDLKKASASAGVQILDLTWLRKNLSTHSITLSDILTRLRDIGGQSSTQPTEEFLS